MKLRNNIVSVLVAFAAIAAPAAGFAAEEKMADAALMEPVKPQGTGKGFVERS